MPSEPCEQCDRDPKTCGYYPRAKVKTFVSCNPIGLDILSKKFSQRVFETVRNSDLGKILIKEKK